MFDTQDPRGDDELKVSVASKKLYDAISRELEDCRAAKILLERKLEEAERSTVPDIGTFRPTFSYASINPPTMGRLAPYMVDTEMGPIDLAELSQ